jgi:hypothetical protein
MPSKVLFHDGSDIRVFSFGHVRHALTRAAAHTVLATITGKKFKPAGTYWQYPVGADRSLRTAKLAWTCKALRRDKISTNIVVEKTDATEDSRLTTVELLGAEPHWV